jgi:hypothetical protein
MVSRGFIVLSSANVSAAPSSLAREAGCMLKLMLEGLRG